MIDDGMRKSARLPSWMPGGGVVLEVHLAGQDWHLPSDATQLSLFHVTLIGRKVFLEQQESMAKVWEVVQPTLPLPPQAELETEVRQAVDEDRKTWFLHIANQDHFRSYVQELSGLLHDAFQKVCGFDFTNPETDRYFHVSIANNQGGDPLKSIGSIKRPNGS